MNIAYTLVGMTRGHASRALAVGGELISQGHDVRFYTNLDAYELLTKRFGFERVFEIEMPKYLFKEGKICISKTLLINSGFIFKREKYTQPILDTFDESWMPDLTVSDFEPLAWWVSQKLKIPHVTLDSQRFMVTSEMPQRLKLIDNVQRIVTKLLLYMFSPSADLRIVSKQFAIPREFATEHYVGAITRRKVDTLVRKPVGEYFLVYIKDSLIPRLPEIQSFAKQLGLKGRVFGISSESIAEYPDLEHGKTCEHGFLDTLSTCEFALTTPGSQTLAETWTLGVPAYLLPEPNQFEQQINLNLAIQAAPEQYAKFENELTPLHTQLTGAEHNRPSLGRTKAVELISGVV